MAALQELHHLCRRHGLVFSLVLLGPTNHRVGSEPIYPHGTLAIRVLDRDRGIAAGRAQSDPGRESLDELAAGCLETLRRKGLV